MSRANRDYWLYVVATYDECINRVAMVVLCNVTSMRVDACMQNVYRVQRRAVDVGQPTAAEVYFFEGVHVGGIMSKASFRS